MHPCNGIFTLAHLLPFSTTIFWTALWSSVSVGSDGRRWVYQKEQVSPSIIQPATARNPGIERLAIDSFPTTAVSNWYVYLKLLTIDRCASSLKINITQMEAFGATPVFFTVCVCEQETEDDSIFSVPLWKSHASWNQTISFSYHCLPSTTICQRIVQWRNQIARQKTPPPWGLWMGKIGGLWYYFGQAALVLISFGRWLWPRFSGWWVSPVVLCITSVVVCLVSCCVGLVQVAAMGLQRLDGFRPVGAAATQLGFDKLWMSVSQAYVFASSTSS